MNSKSASDKGRTNFNSRHHPKNLYMLMKNMI